MRTPPVRYAVTAALAALTAAGHLWLHDWSNALPAEERYHILCDAFTVPGLMLVLITALVALSNEGSFDALGYAVRYTVRRLIPGAASDIAGVVLIAVVYFFNLRKKSDEKGADGA